MRINELCYFTRCLLHPFCPLSEHSPDILISRPPRKSHSLLFICTWHPASILFIQHASTVPIYTTRVSHVFNQHRYPLLRHDRPLTPIVGEHPSLQILSSHLFAFSQRPSAHLGPHPGSDSRLRTSPLLFSLSERTVVSLMRTNTFEEFIPTAFWITP